MTQLVLASGKQLLQHSPLYRFTTTYDASSNAVTITEELSDIAYKPFSKGVLKGFVYFDLWAYSYALQVKHIIQAHDVIKGVLRVRRTTAAPFPIVEDLCALALWFGDVTNVTIRTNEQGNMKYTIVLCELGEQMMLHLEYVTGESRIEFEWSSHQHIVEFDSAQMTGDASNNLNLHYNIEAILAHRVEWNEKHKAQYERIQTLLRRGEQQ